MVLSIAYLDEHLEAIPTLARWHHAQWQAITPELSVDDRIAGFRARARRGSVPTAFVALADGEVAGLACLVADDLDTHRHYTPWLASVLVDPRRRRQGIGSELARRTCVEARAIGVSVLYLFTFDQERFYQRLGWAELERSSLGGAAGTIMTLHLVR